MGLSNWKMPDEWCELLSVISLTNTLMSANALTWWKNGDKSELQKCYILFHPTQKALCTLCLFLSESHCCPMRLWYLRDCSAVWNRLMTETRYTVNKKKKTISIETLWEKMWENKSCSLQTWYASTYRGFVLNQVDDTFHHTSHQSVAYKYM